MTCQIRKLLSWLLLLGAVVLAVLGGLGVFGPPTAQAAIRQHEEAPGQMLYQARQSLRDQRGNTWQVIVFKRTRPHTESTLQLRLAGFPGVAEIDRTQPLTITDSLDKTLLAKVDDRNLFTNGASPQANIGQYNLQPILSQLQPEVSLKLSLPVTNGEAIRLSIAPFMIQEWQTLAEQQSG